MFNLARVEPAKRAVKNVRQQPRIVASGKGGLLRAPHLRGGDELHCPRDLGGAFDRLDAVVDFAESLRHSPEGNGRGGAE